MTPRTATRRLTTLVRLALDSPAGFRAGLYLCALAVAALAFYPLAEPPLTGQDKINHILAFVTLAGLADRAYPSPPAGRRWWIGGLLGYGLFIEIVQYHLPLREFSWLDWLADAAGLLLYLVVSRLAPSRAHLPRAG